MSLSHRSSARAGASRSARRRPGVAAALVVASLIATLSACASTPAGRAHDQVEAGVKAVGRDAWEEAEFRWLKALAIDPGDARALNDLAVLEERRGEGEAAAERYREALDHATGEERDPIRENYEKFTAAGEDSGDPAGGGSSEGGEGTAPVGEESTSVAAGTGDATSGQGAAASRAPVRTREITISVDVPGGPSLSRFERILVGNFVVPESPSGMHPDQLNQVAVRFFRRRLVQRTFFQTVDLLDEPLPSRDPGLLERADMWVERADEVGADLILTGIFHLDRSDSSRVVREQIRSPVTGELEEVARFRQMTRYALTFDYRILRGATGEAMLEGTLEAEREFPVEQGPETQSDAIAETLESMLPQVLEVITPRRAEQTRVLLY